MRSTAPDRVSNIDCDAEEVGHLKIAHRPGRVDGLKAEAELMNAMFGYPAEELLQKSVECLYPSHVEFVHIGDRGLDPMKKSGLYSDERIMRRRSGELFWCHVSGRSLVREDLFACAVWMFEDLSALRPVSRSTTRRAPPAEHITPCPE